MRKTCIFYTPKQVTLLQTEIQRLKLLSVIYPEIIVKQSVPSKLSHRQNYIRLTSSQSAPLYHIGLSTIVYCLKLDKFKKQQIESKYRNYFKSVKSICDPIIYITNNFNEVVQSIVKQLGYQEQKQIVSTSIKNSQKAGKQFVGSEKSRFQKDIQSKYNIKNTPQFVLKSDFLRQDTVMQVAKALRVDIQDIQNCKISVLAQKLEKQLKQYLKQKQIQPLQKQFVKIRQSKTLVQLCRACLHFYTLQKMLLYQNLNFLLRNIRSVIFRGQLQKIKLFSFLLTLNYLYAYSLSYGLEQYTAPPVLYRYTDSIIEPQLVGQIVTIPSFYSVSAKQAIQSFEDKQVKIIIYPLTQGSSSVSVNSLFPIHIFSAFRKQQQFLYLPFTCFLVTQIRFKKSQKKWIVNIKQVPGNPLITKILDINLLKSNQKMSISQNSLTKKKQQTTKAQWELKCQQRYQFSTDPIIKIKTSFNLGLIMERLVQRCDLAINYFSQGIDMVKKALPQKQINSIFMLFKGRNYLGLAYLKNGQLKKSADQFIIAQKLLEDIQYISQTKQANSKLSLNSSQITQKLKYSRAALNNNKSMLSQQLGNSQNALIYYNKALQVLKSCQVKNELMEACILNNIGACIAKLSLQKQNIKQNGFQYLRDSFVKYMQVYGISANIQYQQGSQKQIQDPEKQLLSLTKFISKNKIKLLQLIPIIENCSLIYQLKGNNSMALYYQHQAVQLHSRMNLAQENSSSSIFMKCRLAKLLAKQHKYQQSIELYESLLTVAWMMDTTGMKSASIKANIASVYVNMGNDKELQKAIWWYSEAIRDISSPLKSQNLEFYNKLCDLRKNIQECL